MSSNALDGEDLLNVRLVRMEDVQPSRVLIETCVVNNLVFNDNCVNDEDSNIGSMVSIQSEDVENGSDAELIVPDVLETSAKIKKKTAPRVTTVGWPTLEILPGGVIKHADKSEDSLLAECNDESTEHRKMMYACAKCSQSFKYLFSLVKHVKWHEEEQKKRKGPDLSKLNPSSDEYVCLQPNRKKVVISKSNKKKIPKRLKS